MNYTEIVEREIKERYLTKEKFCEEMNYRYKDFGSKLRTLESKITWINEFLEPLKLSVKLKKQKEN